MLHGWMTSSGARDRRGTTIVAIALAGTLVLSACAARQEKHTYDPATVKIAYQHFKRAESLAKTGDHRGAVAEYRQGLRLVPEDPEAFYELGNSFIRTGDYGSGIEAYKAAIRRNPKFVKAYNNLGNALSGVGQHQQAIVVLKRAVVLDPDYVRAYNNLAVAYDAMGEHIRAIQVLKQAVEIEPDYAAAYESMGNAYGHLKLYDEAIDAYQQAIRLTHPASTPASIWAWCTCRRGRRISRGRSWPSSSRSTPPRPRSCSAR